MELSVWIALIVAIGVGVFLGNKKDKGENK